MVAGGQPELTYLEENEEPVGWDGSRPSERLHWPLTPQPEVVRRTVPTVADGLGD